MFKLFKRKNYKKIIKLLRKDIIENINDYKTIDTILSFNEPILFEHVENTYDFKADPKVINSAIASLYSNLYQPENYYVENIDNYKYKNILIYLIENKYSTKTLMEDNFLKHINKERKSSYDHRYFSEILYENLKLETIKNEDSLIDIVISDIPYFVEFTEIGKIWEKKIFDNIMNENIDGEEKGKKRL